MSTDIDLLPRADLPVIWDDFKVKAELMRNTAETIAVTDISQKEEMALARKTRLTLREIRIAVEHKRVELGEGHLTEIQKINGAARAIREFIEPLEARLLDQETFAERAEAMRIATLADSRFGEVAAINPGVIIKNLGQMSQEEYDGLVARLKRDKAELEAANRLRVEAEKRLDEVRAELQKQAIKLQLELKAESDRLKAEARATLELAQQVALEEKQRRDAEAEQIRFEQEAKLRNERSVAEGVRRLERVAAESRLREEREKTAKLEAENAALEAHLAEVALDAARVAAVEEKRLRDIAYAPDVEKLRAYRQSVKNLPVPSGLAPAAESCFTEAVFALAQGLRIIDQFCERNTA